MLNLQPLLLYCIFICFQKTLGFLQKQTFHRFRFNYGVDMIFSRENRNDVLRSEKRQDIEALINQCQPNGLVATKQQRKLVNEAVRELEKLNPTKNPAYSQNMNGFWRLLYTDFNPPATSAGKLGPFTGTVYQDLDSRIGQIINYLKIKFPKIEGGLVAKQTIKDCNTWQIDFDRTGNYIFGFRFQRKIFRPGSQIRLWKITYLDDEWRIMRGRRPETPENEAFIFILQRDEENRFTLDL